jgi:hypothetical protein
LYEKLEQQQTERRAMSNPTEPIAVATAVDEDDDDFPGRKAAAGAAGDYYGAVDDRGGAGDAGGGSHRDAEYVANYVAPASGIRRRPSWRGRGNVVAALAAVAVLLLLLRVIFPHGFCHHGRCRPWWWHHN